ncbi:MULTISPECIES: DUF916 and DUF3324 domain-containing protein [Enterococcus]|uniref:Uncharacterized protein n=1 Tax=Enterococcus dispar ATCC 51266 TaxID=1139219 RepID=S1NKJ1_9ENTE|nr:DUF916 and DUF3324 domain-containing protein [Enterococcus dispar]EOT38876.1 hypothetical protein OMK_02358 [Enterococcus dispar ATCC 51266]EOW86223.1 hypothetical protein I569_01546 [Enterococcus dispar ATCC 51266]MCU7357166.1 DUF916 and DUF3324 domain-containing protein [Enterococcus dispar]MDT2705246.1 DUF916 and DUF3324 domain-containing protein [Enterococcus dispar]OJG39220.1 hypothetical protein RV01_GL001742 [Enterococcus dispar]
MNKKAWLGIILVYITGLFLGNTTISYADESGEVEGGFSYEVIRPENQIDKGVGYFDLLMKPKQKQTVKIKLNNTGDKEITILVGAYGGKTNSGGVIEYSNNAIENDKSLKYPFESVVKVPKEVKLAANSSEDLNIEIAMPKSEFEGYIAGGILLQEKDAEGAKSQSQQGMVVNKFAYLTGMLLSEKKTDNIKQEMKLNRVYATSKNHRNVINVNYSNIQPDFVDGMTTDVQIMKADADEVVYDAKKSQMRMAPNSMIDFPVSLEGSEMVPGNYRAKILVTTEKGGRWEWEQKFTITDEEADKYNARDLTLVQEPGLNWRLILLIVGGLLIVLLLIYLIVRKMNKERRKKELIAKKLAAKKKKE